MPTFFHSRSVLITHRRFDVYDCTSHAIEDLGSVWVVMSGARVLRRTSYSLMAVRDGAEICLYTTRDATEFGQVRRALQRALEWNADTV